MKTPDEIKRALECCNWSDIELQCEKCPYQQYEDCILLNGDALAYIQQLERELADVKRERDAAVADFTRFPRPCGVCVHGCLQKNDCRELFGDYECNFEWRGVCADNTKETDIRLNNTAHWIMHEGDLGLTCECSNCHIETCGDTPYCPHCGKRMVIEVSLEEEDAEK